MVDLWEFDDALTFVGSTRAGGKRQADLATLARTLSGPRGGTEIGNSLDRVLTRSKARDVLLITDGKSHALDVQALAQRGRRISAVLVGEDSLEANVGHLAALTGGEIFVAAGADLVAALESAVRSLKAPHQAAAPMEGSPQRVAVRRGGMTISARWQPADTATGDALTLRAVAAMAASLALPAMATESAAQLAEAEGLVTHLTSLILIDEAATQEDAIPATRKVALPTPRTDAMCRMVAGMAEHLHGADDFAPAAVRQSFSHGRTKTVVVEKVKRRTVAPGDGKTAESGAAAPAAAARRASPAAKAAAPATAWWRRISSLAAALSRRWLPRRGSRSPTQAPGGKPSGVVLRTLTEEERSARAHALADAKIREIEERRIAEEAARRPQHDRFNVGGLADAIGWDQAPYRLQTGALTDLDPTVARAIRDLAARAEIIELAKKLALDPLMLVIGLLAHIKADRNRSAARIARAIFGKRPRREVDALGIRLSQCSALR
jgi:hypothetical protein